MSVTVTDSNFQTEVLESTLPVLVDCYADWCGPCKMISPIIDQLAKEYEGRIQIGKLDVDRNPLTAMKYNIFSIPTMLLVKDGKLVDVLVGLMPKQMIEQKIKVML